MPQEFILSFIVLPQTSLWTSSLPYILSLPIPSPVLSPRTAFAPVTPKFLWHFRCAFSCHWFMPRIYLTFKFTSRELYLILYDRIQIVFLSRDFPQSQNRVSSSLGAGPVLSSYWHWGAIVCLMCSSGLCSKETDVILLTTLSLVFVITLTMSTDNCICKGYLFF